MAQAPPKPKAEKPWLKYSREKDYLLLEPGFAGQLTDAELLYIQGRLNTNSL